MPSHDRELSAKVSAAGLRPQWAFQFTLRRGLLAVAEVGIAMGALRWAWMHRQTFAGCAVATLLFLWLALRCAQHVDPFLDVASHRAAFVTIVCVWAVLALFLWTILAAFFGVFSN
jgi:hypothetical protein